MVTHKHIVISDKTLCSGCSACASVCPKACITMQEDDMGSNYPHVDTAKCIECGACVKVCPFINPSAITEPVKCFAAININEQVRLKSSSGGVFKALSNHIISLGGIVVGAIFNKNWMVEHICTDNIEGVESIMGSKYVQSETLASYIDTHKHLTEGHLVLYSGTPCQIAGLKHFLRKDYCNLITVEVVCHGVPERGVWRSYLREEYLNEQDLEIEHISFRDKLAGWKKFGLSIQLVRENQDKLKSDSSLLLFYETLQENAYLKAFLRNYSLRPSCNVCQAKSGRSGADVTIGDFWGIGRTEIMPDDDKGVSAIVCRSDKGRQLLQQCNDLKVVECSYLDIFKCNPCLEQSVKYTDNARRFHKNFPRKGFMRTLYDIEHPTLFIRTKDFLKHNITRVLHRLKRPKK